MKVETPEILWNPEGDSNKNAALTDVSLLQVGDEYILATAGNTSAINLWKVRLESSTKIEYLCSLTRHDGPVNCVSFSPDGLHLATGSAISGTIIVFSVPLHLRGGNHGKFFWTSVKEADLSLKILSVSGEGITDLSWSTDSKRFAAGSIDNAVIIVEDESHAANAVTPTQESNWRCVWRNGMDHTHFVQGVAYDPMHNYVASMSSDRSVRIHPRKKKKKKGVEALLAESKLEMTKSKQIKYRKVEEGEQIKKKHLFADESTLESFVRRLAFTRDGAFLVTPAALSTQQHACLLFARHRWEEPCRVLSGLEKVSSLLPFWLEDTGNPRYSLVYSLFCLQPSVAICPNPLRFQLPDDCKENNCSHGLAYRNIFAVLTWDTVYLYDTYHTQPLGMVTNIHYCNLVGGEWTSDGRSLIVCSSDGYVSFLRFDETELGPVHVEETEKVAEEAPMEKDIRTTTSASVASVPAAPKAQPVSLPPCEPGSGQIHEPPTKKAKKIAPTLVAPLNDVGQAVDNLTLGDKKQKKRVQPILMSTN